MIIQPISQYSLAICTIDYIYLYGISMHRLMYFLISKNNLKCNTFLSNV